MFVKHGGTEESKTQPAATGSSVEILTAKQLKVALSEAGVCADNVTDDIEHWHLELLLYVQGNHFTFQEFVDEFSTNIQLGYDAILQKLLGPRPQSGGGWQDGAMH